MLQKPSTEAAQAVTQILTGVENGEWQVSDELLPLVYSDLRMLASARMACLGAGQTFQATELVHEAYMRLVGSNEMGWQGRAHFFGAAARAMRDILADYLRRKGSLKRGGHMRQVSQETSAQVTCDGPSDDALAIEEVLQEFEVQYPRKADVVTMAFFGGLSTPEIAAVLGLSARTVEREWRFAKAWLNKRLSDWRVDE